MHIVRRIERCGGIGPIVAIFEVLFRTDVMQGKPGLKGINSEKRLGIEEASGEFEIRPNLSGIGQIEYPIEERAIRVKPLDGPEADIVEVLSVEFQIEFTPIIFFAD